MERPIFAIEPEAFFVAKLPGGGDVVDSVTIGPGGFHATVNGRPTEQRPVTSEGHVHMLVRVSQDGMRVSALPRGLVGLCPVVEGPVPADDPTPLVPRHQPSHVSLSDSDEFVIGHAAVEDDERMSCEDGNDAIDFGDEEVDPDAERLDEVDDHAAICSRKHDAEWLSRMPVTQPREDDCPVDEFRDEAPSAAFIPSTQPGEAIRESDIVEAIQGDAQMTIAKLCTLFKPLINARQGERARFKERLLQLAYVDRNNGIVYVKESVIEAYGR